MSSSTNAAADPIPSSSTQTETDTSTTSSQTDQQAQTNSFFTTAIETLPKNKPIVFVNLLRFHPQAQYPTSVPDSVLSSSFATPTPNISPTSGREAYFTRYFPTYHAATQDVYGPDANTVQRVLYKGAPLMPLKLATGEKGKRRDESYWQGCVMTRCQSWEVVQRISLSERYVTVGKLHRDAAVLDDELWVSCPVEGFEFEA